MSAPEPPKPRLPEQPPLTGYSFGDGASEARRLELLDQAFSGASAALLQRVGDHPPALAYDLGCGAGATTRLAASVTRAVCTVGLDESQAQLRRAQRRGTPGVRYERHDVTRLPLPAGPGDLIYARFLLAHLAQPLAVARSWVSQLRPGGSLVLDEIEWIATAQPVLAAHLGLVKGVVHSTGARMCAGPMLWDLRHDARLECRVAEVVKVAVPTALASRMFALSLASFGQRAVDLDLIDRDQRDRLAANLAELASSTSTDEIVWGLHQAVYLRRSS